MIASKMCVTPAVGSGSAGIAHQAQIVTANLLVDAFIVPSVLAHAAEPRSSSSLKGSSGAAGAGPRYGADVPSRP